MKVDVEKLTPLNGGSRLLDDLSLVVNEKLEESFEGLPDKACTLNHKHAPHACTCAPHVHQL